MSNFSIVFCARIFVVGLCAMMYCWSLVETKMMLIRNRDLSNHTFSLQETGWVFRTVSELL